MLFSRIKKSRNEMFDREYEFDKIVSAIKDGVPLIVVTGIRRVGKTTLVKVLLNEIDTPGVYIDARKLWSTHANISPNVIKKEILKSLNARKSYAPVMRLLKSLKSVTIAGSGVEFKDKNTDLIDVLDDIENSGERAVIIFDEAQYLRYSNYDYTALFASLNDSYENITLILTGSEIGVLEEFLGFNDRYSPLYKREHEIVHLDRFSRGESMQYLMKGFHETGMDVPDEEIRDAVEVLDGIVGWLREYGWLRYRGRSHGTAIDEVFQRAKSDIIDELSRYSRRYLTIMMAVSEGYNAWSSLKAYLERAEGKRINDGSLNTALRNLIKYGYLEKHGDEYRITDPVIERALRHAR
ncbi:AAA family ATPase [Thermococcus barophilus]|uniref:Uncharacterized protein n=1 Tax=Thermococcus barophilus (strain DSM 11836 / MP) TaxID=391623 RepID=F0LLW5_THEBM|nr:ATP-binding protein [Thermococcus barophilus]ADT85064.1 hypothetical protein TERMP_02090 [Thermococcus barophilus MP]